jgi:hypothetical protein
VGLTAEEVGLTLAEGKDLLGELARLILLSFPDICRAILSTRRGALQRED